MLYHDDLLQSAELVSCHTTAASNYGNTLTGVTLFFADYGFHPQTSMEPLGIYKSEQKVKFLAVDKIVRRQAKMITFLQDQLVWAQDKQIWFANQDCQSHSEYQIANEIYVDSKYFASEKSKKSFNLKNAGPWKISRIINNKIYKLEILQHMKNAGFTLIFHLWKLYLAPNNPFPGQVLLPELPISIQNDNNNDTHNKWKY